MKAGINLRRIFTSRTGLIVLILVVVVVATVLIVGEALAPSASTVKVMPCITSSAAASQCLRFPTVTGTNLNNVEVTLPEGMIGTLNFVAVSFEREQTVRADTWLPLAQELIGDYPDFAYYSVPVIPALAAPVRLLAMTGMASLVSDEHLRDITVVLFLEERDAFIGALEFTDTTDIAVLLLNADGEVVWRGVGEFDETKGTALRDEVAARITNAAN